MIIGHEKIIEDLKRLTLENRLGHGYVFFGPSMVGKRTVAQGLAHFLENGIFEPESENHVLQDTRIIDRAYMQSLDPTTKDSIGIDASREIKNFLWQKPNTSPRRTLILDETELLTTEAQNALLKVAEEPPASSLLILIASDIESIMPTIISRLPKVYFGTIPEAEIAAWLVERYEITKTKAAPIANKSLGKPGLASRLLNDEGFEERIATAQKFLKTTSTSRKEFIKKLIDPDDFNLRRFLESVIITLAWEKPSKANAALWHKTLALYDTANNFGLSPRIQLENLLR